MNLYGKIIGNKYKIISKIEEGGMSTIWQAFDNNDNKVVVKVLKKNLTSNRVEDIIRFKGEATNVSKLLSEGIAKVYDIGEYENLYYIVLEYVEGDNLQELLNKGCIFSIDEVLNIIYDLCKILKEVHSINIIHKDIKPGNVIVKKVLKDSNETYKVTLIDFGLSLIRNFDFENSSNLIGTVLYMPPEQSGFIKSTIDDRADLYSLGIMFYQLLSNRLPFEGNDLNSIIYQHIAKKPTKLTKINHQLPVVLEKIVFKLIEKEPEKRYQSVLSLIKDIELFKKGDVNFEPGLNDNLLKLNYRTNLIGRETEYNYLKEKIDESVKGVGSICILKGIAGSGKTRLVEELRSYIYKEKIVFIEGKCFLGENTVPFDSFKEAFNNYVKYFKKYSDKDKIKIKNNIKKYIGELGKVVIDFNPVLKDIIGDVKSTTKLDLINEKARLNIVITDLIKAISKSHKGLVVLIDDIQWIDEGSLNLLNTIAVDIKNYNIIFICAYRNDNNSNENKVNEFLKSSQYKKYNVFNINLDRFNFKDTKKLSRFLTEQGKMIPRRTSGNCARSQRQLAIAVKRARHLALLPYVADIPR
jgi:ribosomal protein S18